MTTRLQLSILVALTAEPLNGHAVSTQIRSDTESTFIPSHQSVYQALSSLERKKDVETISTPDELRYQITPQGRHRLKTEQRYLELTLGWLKSRS
jgi:DNA-binding PadR family transcriptional regulator